MKFNLIGSIVCLLSVSLLSPSTWAEGTDAHSTSNSQQGMDYVNAGVSGAMSIPYWSSCSIPAGWYNCVIGGGLTAGAVMSVVAAGGRNDNIRLTGGNPLSGPCLAGDPSCYTAAPTPNPDPNGNTSGSPYANDRVPGGGGPNGPEQIARNYIDDSIKAAEQHGFDPKDPKGSLDKIAKAAGFSGADDPKMKAEIANRLAEDKARNDRIRAQVTSKFGVSSVGVEDGGGGGLIGRGDKGDNGINLDALLKGLEGEKERKTASSEGLNKTIGGEPIGIASDNIFKQMTRRYQTKIKRNDFITR